MGGWLCLGGQTTPKKALFAGFVCVIVGLSVRWLGLLYGVGTPMIVATRGIEFLIR